MVLRPCTVKCAQKFVAVVHRRLPAVQGGMWAVACHDGAELIGVAIVGHAARLWNEDTLGVLRVAVREGYPNACSMLYGACARAAKAMGSPNLVTYTHGDESGVSLKAAGWIDGGLTRGGQHTRPSRSRKPVVDAAPKRRWFAPWSERAAELRRSA